MGEWVDAEGANIYLGGGRVDAIVGPSYRSYIYATRTLCSSVYHAPHEPHYLTYQMLNFNQSG